MLIEFVTGLLPWHNERADKAKIKQMKLALTTAMCDRPGACACSAVLILADDYAAGIPQLVNHLTALS